MTETYITDDGKTYIVETDDKGCERTYDENGRLIIERHCDDEETDYKYDSRGNVIFMADYTSDLCYKEWNDYDENNNLVHMENNRDEEEWREYDDRGNCIHITNVAETDRYFDYDHDACGYLKITEETHNTYDADNKLREQRIVREEYTKTEKNIMYDENGKIVRSEIEEDEED